MGMDTSTNRELQNEYIERRFLEQLKPALQFFKYAREGTVPGGMGDSIRWLNFPEFSVDTSALSESTATDNEISSYAANAVSGSISPYGQWIKISEHQAKTQVVGTLDQISERLAYLGARTVDTLLMNAALTATHYWKEGQTAADTGNVTSANTLRAQTFSHIESYLTNLGNTGFSSEGGQYVAILNPNQVGQLRVEATTASGLPTWSELNKYVAGAQDKTTNGDAGSLFGVAIKASPLIVKQALEVSGTGGASVSVSGYKAVVLATDGIGRAGIGDMEPTVKIKSPGKNSTDQPLDTFWTYGVKFRAAHKLLSNDRVLILWSYAS